jgi:hypothetical protein
MQKTSDWTGSRESIRFRGFLDKMQDTKTKLKVTGFLTGPTAKRLRSSSTFARSRDRGGWRPGSSNCRRPGQPRVRPRRGIERGDRRDRVGMLTSGGEQRKTQDFEEWRSSVTAGSGSSWVAMFWRSSGEGKRRRGFSSAPSWSS